MKTARTFLIVLTALLGAAAQADAGVSTFGFADIQNWTGTGANQAMLIVDWNGNASQSLAWGYRWNGDATGEDMLRAIAGSGIVANIGGTVSNIHGTDERLFLAMNMYTFGASVFGLGYDVNNNKSAFVPGGAGATDSADFYAEGWATSYWSYNIANLGSVDVGAATWQSPFDFGVSGRSLTNNDADAWILWPSADWMLTPTPNIPVAAAAVPEPTCLVALLMGGAVLAKRRCRNAKAMDN